ncbi:MAG: hypothetical protein ACHQQQ_08960 [Bacteroidota bacterium]
MKIPIHCSNEVRGIPIGIDVRRLPARTTQSGRLLPTPAKKTAGKAVGIAMTFHTGT